MDGLVSGKLSPAFEHTCGSWIFWFPVCMYLSSFLSCVCTSCGDRANTAQSDPKVGQHRGTWRTLAMWRRACWSPPPSGHPTVLRADFPEAALCPVTSAGPGVGPELNSQVLTDLAVPKRVQSGGETAKDLHTTKNLRRNVMPQLLPFGERTTAAQIKTTVNSSLWFIQIITHGLSIECIFSQVFDCFLLFFS